MSKVFSTITTPGMPSFPHQSRVGHILVDHVGTNGALRKRELDPESFGPPLQYYLQKATALCWILRELQPTHWVLRFPGIYKESRGGLSYSLLSPSVMTKTERERNLRTSSSVELGYSALLKGWRATVTMSSIRGWEVGL